MGDVLPGLERRVGADAAGDRLARLSRLTTEIFEIDFDEWADRDLIDPNYIPVSYLLDGQIIANVSVYSLDMLVGGAPARALQVCTCATLEAYRGRGLASELLTYALEQYRPGHDFVFLFSTDEAVPLYRRLGFRPVVEELPSIRPSRPASRLGTVRLDMDHSPDVERLVTFADGRTPVSSQLGVKNTSLLMFHCLHRLREHLHHIAELDCVVAFAHQDDGRLRIYDIIGERVPTWSELHPYLVGDHEVERVEFMFLPELLQVTDVTWTPIPDNNLHILGESPFADARVLFPYTAQA